MRTRILVASMLSGFLAEKASAQWVQTDLSTGATNITVLVANNRNIYAGTELSGLFRSTDNGQNWTPIDSGLTSTRITALAARETTMFAGTHFGGMFLSTNSGTSWTPVNTGLALGIINAIAANDTYVFTGIDAALGVFRTSDNGTNWTAADVGMEHSGVNAFAVSGKNVFVGTRIHLYLSTDNGLHWTAADSGLSNKYITALAVAGAYLFAGTSSGVFVSSNEGTTWTERNAGLVDKGVQTFCVSDANVFVSTWNKGGEVFLSTNYGANWIPANEGLPTEYDCVINNLVICKGSVFAGSASRGVWQRQLSEMVTSNKRAPELAEHFSLHQNYPNPFNPSTTIKFELPKSSKVTLTLFDVLGREVSVLVDDRREPGVHEVKFSARGGSALGRDGSNLASGVYFYRLHAGDFVATKRLLLLK